MKSEDLEWLNFFRTLAQPHKFKTPFHMHFEF